MTRGQGITAGPQGEASQRLVGLLIDYLDDVAARTARRLGDVGGVAITMAVGAAPVTLGASSDLALDVDLIQYAVGLGPCLNTLESGVGLYVADLADDDRWGDYGPRAADRGAVSCITAPVVVNGEVTAVLKAYATFVGGFDEEQFALLEETAGEIAGGIGLAQHLSRQATELDDRQAAMDTRRTIDLALGMLMERTGGTSTEAFDLLRRYSQTSNVKLNDAARRVVGLQAGVDLDHAPFAAPGTLA